MPRGKPVIIDKRSFPTQGAAHAFFKEMLSRYRPGTRINDTDAADLAALLKRHRDFAEKAGCGISHFETMRDPKFGTKCFKVVRHDGSGEDFTYQRCIDQRWD